MKSVFSSILILLFLLLSSSAICNAASDEEPSISDIIITTSQTHLLLFCSVNNSLTPEMLEGVRSGIPVTFTFQIELEEVKKGWFDKTLTELTIQHTLTYNAIKEQYMVQRSEKATNPLTTESLDKATEAMVELNGLKIIPRDALVPDAPYAIHVKATLAEKTLPLYMHYIIPFISLWDFETDWRTIEFRY